MGDILLSRKIQYPAMALKRAKARERTPGLGGKGRALKNLRWRWRLTRLTETPLTAAAAGAGVTIAVTGGAMPEKHGLALGVAGVALTGIGLFGTRLHRETDFRMMADVIGRPAIARRLFAKNRKAGYLIDLSRIPFIDREELNKVMHENNLLPVRKFKSFRWLSKEETNELRNAFRKAAVARKFGNELTVELNRIEEQHEKVLRCAATDPQLAELLFGLVFETFGVNESTRDTAIRMFEQVLPHNDAIIRFKNRETGGTMLFQFFRAPGGGWNARKTLQD